MGFTSPTPIQEKSIPILLESTDNLVGLAQTGTGKTAAFSIPIIQSVKNTKSIEAIILCPTRELCMQIHSEVKLYSKYLKNVSPVAVYGGASVNDQIKSIKRSCNIVIGTPGRTLDLINRKVLNLVNIKHVVLDEADEMLNMGFKEDINAILKNTPEEKRMILFSATMSKGIERIASNYMGKLQKITIGSKNSSAKNITHNFALVQRNEKIEALKRFIDSSYNLYGIIFSNTRHETKSVAEALMNSGYKAEALHGDLSQSQRDYVMKKFKNKSINLLVATDIAARGIDVSDVTHVFHLNLPDEIESYTHRSGRTARAGKHGLSIALVQPRSKNILKRIEKQCNVQISPINIPSKEDIIKAQSTFIVDRIIAIKDHEKLTKEVAFLMDELTKQFPQEVIIQKLLAASLSEIINKHSAKNKLNVAEDTGGFRESRGRQRRDRDSRDKGRSRERSSKGNNSRLYINIGKMDGLDNKSKVLDFVCKSGITGKDIGKIDLFDKFTFINVVPSKVSKVLDKINGSKLNERKIKVELSKERI